MIRREAPSVEWGLDWTPRIQASKSSIDLVDGEKALTGSERSRLGEEDSPDRVRSARAAWRRGELGRRRAQGRL